MLSGLVGLRRLPRRGAVIFESITCFSRLLPSLDVSDRMTTQSPDVTCLTVPRYNCTGCCCCCELVVGFGADIDVDFYFCFDLSI